jgi:hypothetical protein
VGTFGQYIRLGSGEGGGKSGASRQISEIFESGPDLPPPDPLDAQNVVPEVWRANAS